MLINFQLGRHGIFHKIIDEGAFKSKEGGGASVLTLQVEFIKMLETKLFHSKSLKNFSKLWGPWHLPFQISYGNGTGKSFCLWKLIFNLLENIDILKMYTKYFKENLK